MSRSPCGMKFTASAPEKATTNQSGGSIKRPAIRPGDRKQRTARRGWLKMDMTMNCKTCQTHLPDLLLESGYEAAHPELAAHLKACESCAKELAELRSTFELMDDWTAPEPSPYFDSKLRARVREAAEAQPEGVFERLYAFLTFSTGWHLRSALAGALMVVLLIGGGTFAGFEIANRPGPAQPSAAVN